MSGNSDPRNFLFFNNRFEEEFRGGLGERYDSFKVALNLFLQNNGKTIVETGTLRHEPKSDEFWNDGGSTYLFGRFCEEYGKRLYTVDISRKAIETSKKVTKEFEDHITYVTSDSIEFLRNFEGKIDLLYLDSLDCLLEGDATEAQKHQLNELAAAVSKLSDGALILLDDNKLANGGKTRLAKEYLFYNGFTLLIDDRQSLWIKTGRRVNVFCRLAGWKDLVFPYGTSRQAFYIRDLQPMIRRLASGIRAYNTAEVLKRSGVVEPPSIKKLFIDCSYVYKHGGNSGIQRAVRNIVSNCESVGEKLQMECQPVAWTGTKFITVESVGFEGRGMFLAERVPAKPKPPLLRGLRGWLKEVLPKPAVRIIRGGKRAATTFAQAIYRSARGIRDDIRFWGKRISFKEGDVLLLLDSSWDFPFWGGIRKARARGATVGLVLYDLIPIYAPQFCHFSLVDLFKNWIETAVTVADFAVSISDATKNEFERYLKGNGIHPIRAASFRLGAGLDRSEEGGYVRSQVKKVFAGKSKPYIIVTTIEPRKNHEYLLDAFEKVWEMGVEAKLCIIGKIGWQIEDLTRRIEGHPQRGELLFMFNDLSDTELSFCYENAKALVTPSLYEGFNLPIVEALSKGLPVLASNIPIHRETCGDYCVYFDLESLQSLVKLITDFEKKGRLPPVKSPEDFRWISWEESTEDLLKKVKRLAWEQR